mmetsp:Transcript_81801/g.162330  ORF Transcript_81801/g.162330 Transcript_81801/m.162330 type:complete len:122 (+) Transcript_81801:72-437(+)
MGNCAVDPSSLSGSLELSFWQSTDEKREAATISFTERPLGLTFKKQRVPIIIDEVDDKSLADLWGVEKGMVLATVQGRSVDGLTYDETFGMLQQGLENLPQRRSPLQVSGRDIGPSDDLGC